MRAHTSIPNDFASTIVHLKQLAVMYSRKDFPEYNGSLGQPMYNNVQQLAQDYRRMTSSRDNVSKGRSKEYQSSFDPGSRSVHDKFSLVSDPRVDGAHQRPNLSRTYRQRNQGEYLYENESFYRKQAIYKWMSSSEQVKGMPVVLNTFDCKHCNFLAFTYSVSLISQSRNFCVH